MSMKLDKHQEVESAVAGDSISSVGVPVNVKDYTPSEVFTHEPPPAYKKPKATAVQIARIAAFTVISCSLILGLCIITSSWIEATASCSQLIHAEALLNHQQQNEDVGDRPSYQALVDPLQSDESSESKQESIAATASPPPPPQQPMHSFSHHDHGNRNPSQSQSAPIQIKLPLQLDFDELAGTLMEKNQRSRMNCVVEKKSAEEVTDHQPKTVRLPFGVNITTDPRYEHVTGERMAIYCESGHDQRHLPMEQMQPQPQHQAPMIVPMPMPMQMQMSQMPMNLPLMMPHPSHSMPMPHGHPHPHPHHNHMPPISMAPSQEDSSSLQKEESEGPITIIAREEHVIPVFQPVVSDVRPIPGGNLVVEGRGMPEKILYQSASAGGPEGRGMPEGRMMHTFAISENRQPPLAIFETRPSGSPHNGVGSNDAAAMPAIPSEIVRPPPPPAFHKIPIHVPTVLQQIENQQQQTLNENILEEEAETDPRPHYVQPRSVRSVDSQMNQQSIKRTRRYACSCTC
ncbi:uncharacterized protein Msr-110 [Planococcus citri]|uniref:uncharacterized protein Msr-110 n=1 Tax=Planococcus citri TaxID=170843 RepID=UPI0031F95E91